MGHHYDLPVNVYGFSTNSHALEIQSGYERALNAAIPALAGGCRFHPRCPIAADICSLERPE
jgi:trimethylamine:corrinoid methyltransferase-like protein